MRPPNLWRSVELTLANAELETQVAALQERLAEAKAREAEMSDTASAVVALRSSAHTSLFSQPRAYLLSRHPPHRHYPSRPPSHVPDSRRDDSERPIAAATVSDITGVHRG